MTKNRTLTAALTAIALLGGTAISMAQPATDQGGAPAQQNGGDRRAEFRERMNQQMKENLGATDDEWKVLQPKIEKVMQLRMQANGFGMMGMGGGRGRRGGGGDNNNATGGGANQQPQSEAGKAAQDLRTALNDKSSSVDTIKAKLDALRTARAKAREDLAAAQKDLQSVVSVKQEAFLVMVGALD